MNSPKCMVVAKLIVPAFSMVGLGLVSKLLPESSLMLVSKLLYLTSVGITLIPCLDCIVLIRCKLLRSKVIRSESTCLFRHI